jgi:hypothetical protein
MVRVALQTIEVAFLETNRPLYLRHFAKSTIQACLLQHHTKPRFRALTATDPRKRWHRHRVMVLAATCYCDSEGNRTTCKITARPTVRTRMLCFFMVVGDLQGCGVLNCRCRQLKLRGQQTRLNFVYYQRAQSGACCAQHNLGSVLCFAILTVRF